MVAVMDIWVAAEDWWMVAMMGEMHVVRRRQDKYEIGRAHV